MGYLELESSFFLAMPLSLTFFKPAFAGVCIGVADSATAERVVARNGSCRVCICFCGVVRNSGCSPERRKPSTSRSARYLAIPRFFAFCLRPLVFKVPGIMKEAQTVD